MFNFNFQQNDVKHVIKSSSYTNKDPNRKGALESKKYVKHQPKPARTSQAAPVFNFSGLRQVTNLYGVVVCVNYSDFFKHSLESARGQFKKILVITTPTDKDTIDLCKNYDFVEVVETDVFFNEGRKFDKGAGINLGLNKIPTDQANWCLIFDADIVFPNYMSKYLSSKALDSTVLFGAPRHFVRNPEAWKEYVDKNKHISSLSEVYNPGITPIGYFQLFNSQNLLLSKMRYPEGHDDASTSDLMFTRQFNTRTTLKHISVIHLGDDGRNWKGRITPSFDPALRPAIKYPIPNRGKDLTDLEICMSRPVRNLKDNFEFQKFLKDTKIYVSLTTSPLRIKKLTYPLNTLDYDIVEKVILSVPKKYRGKESYVIPDYILNDSKIIVHRDFKDVGPLSKLTPALSLLKKIDPNSILITIDDDTLYPYGMCTELAYELFKNSNTVVTASAPDLSFWGISSSDFPNNYTKVSEGFAGIAYRVSDIPKKAITEMIKIAGSCSSCKFSDDIVHSFVLSKYDIGVKILSNMYYDLNHIRQLDYGFQDDAIFKASGLPEFKEILDAADVRPDGVNMYKYKDCVSKLNNKYES